MPALLVLSILLTTHANFGQDQEIQRSLKLWKEFGRPNAIDEYLWDNNPSYRREHFEESRELSVALSQTEKGDFKRIVEIAKGLLKSVRTWDMHDEEWLGSPKRENLEGRTAMLIYKHLVNDFLDKKPALPILDSLKKLQKKKLIDKRWKYGRTLAIFVSELGETVKSSGKPPGTLEYAIDKLSDISDADSHWGESGWEPKEFKAIEAFGLDAIPTLVNMLGTKKLSHTFEHAIMNRRAQITHVDTFIHRLIFRITDDEMASGSIEKDVVLGWLDAKRKGKIKDWIISRLFVESKNHHPYGNPWAFESLAKKYPYLLKWAYGEMIHRKIEPAAAIRGLEESPLSREDKLEILDRFLALDYDHVGSALSVAHDMDMARFDKTILRYISEIPSSFNGKSTWAVRSALGTDNRQVWDLVKSKIDHADPLMKMQLLSCLGYGDNYNDVRASRAIQMLALYFDNKEVVSPKTKVYKDQLKVELEPGLTVGQVALETASTKGRSLTMPEIPRKDKAGWQKIREQIESQYRIK